MITIDHNPRIIVKYKSGVEEHALTLCRFKYRGEDWVCYLNQNGTMGNSPLDDIKDIYYEGDKE